VARASQYHWLLPPGVKFTEGTPTTGNHILLDLEDNFEGGTLSVAGKNGCGVGALASFGLSVPARIAAGQPIGGNDTLCAGQPEAVFTTHPLANATSYHWKLQLGAGPVAQFVTAEPTLTIHVPNQAQSGSLSVAGSNACRTGMYSPPFAFAISTVPAAEVAGPREVCPGKATVEYSTEPVAGCRSYDWKLPAHVRPLTGSTVTSANRISVHILDGFTGGIIQVSATNRCGTGIPSAGLAVRAMPALPVPILSQSCNTLHVQAQAYPLQWYVDEMPVAGQTDEQLTLRQKGTYTVRVFGPCDTTSASLVAEPITATPEDVPNVFTPNGDKWNETFQLADKLKGASLVVQNRWGRVVYESSNYQNDWDGQALSPGVYYYYLKISCQSRAVRGIVQLLR
jgi:gliding motility-associated-like protein